MQFNTSVSTREKTRLFDLYFLLQPAGLVFTCNDTCLRGRKRGVGKVIVVAAGSTDATLATAAAAAAELALPLRTAAAPLGGRGPAVRAGCALATGEVHLRFARWN